MPLVNFRAAAIKQYGLPQACPCCGNDDDGQLVLEPAKGSSSGWRYGCCLVSLFLGPIGWIVGALTLMTKNKELPFPLPVCRLCLQARERLWQRFAGILVLSSTVFFVTTFGKIIPGSNVVNVLAVSVGLLGGLEYLMLRRQFRVAIRSSNQDLAVAEVPYEEYPALYQRHLDNAALYGSSDRLGTLGEE